MNENLNIEQENGSVTFTSRVVFQSLIQTVQPSRSRVKIRPILLENPESQPICDRDRKNPDCDICFDKYQEPIMGSCKYTRTPKRVRLIEPGGGYFRTFGVGMCRWDPETLSLAKFTWTSPGIPYTRLNSPNPPYPRVAVFQKQLWSLTQSSQNKTDLIFLYSWMVIPGFPSLD